MNRPAAKFVLTSYAGEPMSLEAHRGRVVVVNFWASWCMPACYEEAPVLERNWRAYRDKGVVVLGVDIQDKPEAARKFIDQFSLTFPNALDPAGKVSVDYGVYGVPETYVVDRKGTILYRHVGPVTPAAVTANLMPVIERALAEN